MDDFLIDDNGNLQKMSLMERREYYERKKEEKRQKDNASALAKLVENLM